MKFILIILWAFLASATAQAQSTYSAQIHNAPGWQPSTSYTYSAGPPAAPFTRVVAGAGWTPSGGQRLGTPGRDGLEVLTGKSVGGSGTWNPGSALNAYQLTSVGTCTSAAAGSGPSSSDSSIADGTCTWKYLSGVDYVSITGWALDNGSLWTSGTDYGVRHVVNAGVNADVYQQQVAGCHSTVKPTGTAAEITTSDGCIWNYVGTIYYTSRTKSMPHDELWFDTFQGYLSTATFSANGSVASGNILTLNAVAAGSLHKGATIAGNGIPSGQTIYAQKSGMPGGIGTYVLSNFQSDVTSTGISGSYGLLTVTTPPATHSLDPTKGPVIVSSKGMAYPGRGNGDGYTGTYVVESAGRNSWVVSVAQTFGTAESPASFSNALMIHGKIGYDDLYHAQLWNDREYVTGQNGEKSPISIWNHNYHYNDSVQSDGYGVGPNTEAAFNKLRGVFGFPFYIESAPGEGFGDTFAANPRLALAGYNPNYGVAIRGVGTNAISLLDNSIVFKGLQVTSDTYAPMFAPARACNLCVWEHNLLEGGSGTHAYTVTNCGAACNWYDNLFVVHGIYGVTADYGGKFYYNTFVCPSGTCQSAMSNTWNWVNLSGMVINGNAVFGFKHFTSSNFYHSNWAAMGQDCSWNCATVQGTHNASDVPATDGADFPNSTFSGGLYTPTEYALPFQTGSHIPSPPAPSPRPICGFYDSGGKVQAGKCGILNSVPASAAFVAWPGNYRINPRGPLVGGGASSGSWNFCVWTGVPAPGCTVQADTPDLFGLARPQGGRYDIGAVEFVGPPELPVNTRKK
jgi:hypothetical protein